ncbi:phage minor head protein [Vibrio sp. OPT18]|uniref:phage head morphogenesis protein n=1 Tax=Vibrio sp. OPT18 TaxID=2778641 RepID=UPI001881FD2B|nr:phage minor head protein [Vibrio sp. OPT18]MBE8578722.1 minor capsid protein [Vibrio sp. OPT18]
MPIESLLKQEKRNLNKMKGLEDSALLFTAKKLSELIKSRLNKNSIPLSSTKTFAEVFTDSMVLAWLYGQKHLIDTTKKQINLADDDVTVQFSEAIDHLNGQVPLDQKTYQRLEANLKLRAFTIASVMGEESMQRVKKYYTDALELGQSKSEVMQNIDGLLSRAGITESNPYYLELHYRNNMMSAYNFGRWTQVEHNELVEYLMYSSVLDDGTTELCKHLDKTVKPKGDSFWKKYYPPNHHKCRAIVMAIAAEMYKALSKADKQRSSSITEASLARNSTYQKEHQFKNSPTASLDRIPSGLMQKAKEHKLEADINNQTFKQSKSLIQDTFTAAQAKRLTDGQVKQVVSKNSRLNGKEEQIADLAKSDEAYYGLHELGSGDAVAAIYLVTWIEKELASVTRMGAFDEKVQDVSSMSKSEVIELVAGKVRVD